MGKAEKAKEIGGKVSDIANKFGKKEESGNKIIGVTSQLGNKVELKPKDKNKVEEKSEECKKDVDKDTTKVECKKKETESDIVKDIKGDKCKELNNEKVINEKGTLGNDKISEGNVDKVEKVEEDKTNNSTIGTNNVKVEDKTGNKVDGENSIVKDNDNKKVDDIEIGKEINKVGEGMIKLIKGLEEIGNEEGNKVSEVKVEQREQNLIIKDVEIEKGIGEREKCTGESSKVVTSPDLDNRDGKKLVNNENEDIATEKSTKTVTPVADCVAGKQPVIL